MLWACILLPQLALDAALRRQPDPDAPLALVSGAAPLRRLQAVNAAAAAAGLRPGMRLAAAQALLAQLRTLDYQPEQEDEQQRLLAAWAYRHSSLVSLQWPGMIVFEAEASFRLFGPWPHFEQCLREELRALDFQHRIALAPTPRAARVLAGLRDGAAVTQLAALRALLDRVPVRRAALPSGDGERLWRMGVRTLAALRALPRAGLRRRFGAPLLEHLDRLYGDCEDSLPYYAPPDHFDQRLELGYEVEQHGALLFPLRRLIGDLCTCLSIRDGGVQHFVLRLEHAHRHSDVDVGLLAPERAPALLFELARSRLERAQIPAPVTALRLLARQLPSFVPARRDLFDSRPQQALDWPQLRERLRARLGDAAVYALAAGDDPRPERAWRRCDEAAEEASVSALADATSSAVENAAGRGLPPRPTWLLPRPLPLARPPARLLAGPERLESGWWDGEDARRDYYLIEASYGRRGWAFVPAGRHEGWMLHGWFA